MRSISPVIATVILLLITVAAGGLAYLTITGFQDQSQSGGEGAFEALSESTQSQVKIESVAGGRVYLRNIGTVPLSNFRVYVAGEPCRIITCPDILDPKGANVCDLDCPPGECPDGYVQLTVGTGGASDTQRVKCEEISDYLGPTLSITYSPTLPTTLNSINFNVTASELDTGGRNVTNCSIKMGSGSWNYIEPYDGFYDSITEVANYTHGPQMIGSHNIYAECNDTLNNTGESSLQLIVYPHCGNNICESTVEDELNCPGDCDILMYVADALIEGVDNSEVYVINFNVTYNIVYDLTNTSYLNESGTKGVYDSQGNFMATWMYNSTWYENVLYSFWNKTDWEPVGNITTDHEASVNREMVSDDSGNIMMVMQTSYNDIRSSLWDGDSWGPVVNVTTDSDTGRAGLEPDIGLYENTPIVVWRSWTLSPNSCWIRSALWNGTGWDNHQNITTVCVGRAGVVTSTSGPATAVFAELIMGGYQLRSAQWNGTGWDNYQNVTGELSSVPGAIHAARDYAGRDIAAYLYDGTTHWSVRDEGVWSASQSIGGTTSGGILSLVDNIQTGIFLIWAEDYTPYVLFKVSRWDSFSKSFKTPETAYNCTSGVPTICREV